MQSGEAGSIVTVRQVPVVVTKHEYSVAAGRSANRAHGTSAAQGEGSTPGLQTHGEGSGEVTIRAHGEASGTLWAHAEGSSGIQAHGEASNVSWAHGEASSISSAQGEASSISWAQGEGEVVRPPSGL